MKGLISWGLIFVIIWNGVLTNPVKIVEKRDCSYNGCGNSCDGTNCNICNSDVCCSSAPCNRCVNECSSQCSTTSCRQNCVSGCSNSCQSQSCAVQSCSQCVNKCSNQCSTNQCVNSCSKKCDDKCVVEPEPPLFIEPPQSPNIYINNTNNNLVNLTTHINLNNVIHNYNNISIPVFVNTTNINNIVLTENETGSSRNGNVVVRPEPFPIVIPYPIPQQSDNNCCYVMHPRTCYTDDEGDRRCVVRRHKECSNTCTSPVVTIQENDETVNSRCHYIRNYPYVYCGNYERRDCGQCYNCNGGYNPGECSRQSGCSETCKKTMPNCVPSQSGLQCY